MIEKSQIMPLNYYKKNNFTGSSNGMRYKLSRIEEGGESFFCVSVWPEPYNFDKTKEEEKVSIRFPFSEEGREQAVLWLNEQYERQNECGKKDFRKGEG